MAAFEDRAGGVGSRDVRAEVIVQVPSGGDTLRRLAVEQPLSKSLRHGTSQRLKPASEDQIGLCAQAIAREQLGAEVVVGIGFVAVLDTQQAIPRVHRIARLGA